MSYLDYFGEQSDICLALTLIKKKEQGVREVKYNAFCDLIEGYIKNIVNLAYVSIKHMI